MYIYLHPSHDLIGDEAMGLQALFMAPRVRRRGSKERPEVVNPLASESTDDNLGMMSEDGVEGFKVVAGIMVSEDGAFRAISCGVT